MRMLIAFALGVRQFRSDWTTHYFNMSQFRAYEWGREWAHRLTFRYYDA